MIGVSGPLSSLEDSAISGQLTKLYNQGKWDEAHALLVSQGMADEHDAEPFMQVSPRLRKTPPSA
jgi:hypothetical protein